MSDDSNPMDETCNEMISRTMDVDNCENVNYKEDENLD